MLLDARITQLEQVERRALRQAIDAAEQALAAREALEADILHGRVPQQRSPHMKPLREAWDPLKSALARHATSEAVLDQHIREYVANPSRGLVALQGLVRLARAEHEQLTERARVVTSQLAFQLEVRSAFLHCTLSLDAATRVEEVELFPAIDAGQVDAIVDRENTPDKWRTSDDVARSLRTNRPAAPRDAAPPTGPVQRMKGWFSGGSSR